VVVRLLVAGLILVGNGVLLVMVLRLLLLVVIRRVHPNEPATEAMAPLVVRPRPPAPPAATPSVPAGGPARPPAGPVITAASALERKPNRYRIHHHRMLLGVPALAVIFAAGAWLGDWVGNGGATAAAATRTVHLKGQVIYRSGSTVEVKVPATTLTVGGQLVTVPSTVIIPGSTDVRTLVLPVPGPTKTWTTRVTTTISVPTTVTDTSTETVPVTTTVTDTTTATDTTTETVTVTATT
jgi:hypothetical protein